MATLTTKWVSALLVAGLMVCAGCSKADKNRPQPTKAAMDLPKFKQAFTAATKQQEDAIAKVNDGVRYSMYPQAIEGLEQLAADPALTDAQKKAVNDMIAGVKQAMNPAPAAPAK